MTHKYYGIVRRDDAGQETTVWLGTEPQRRLRIYLSLRNAGEHLATVDLTKTRPLPPERLGYLDFEYWLRVRNKAA